jgi:flagellar biosynthesis anti-sigma factor FlgM
VTSLPFFNTLACGLKHLLAEADSSIDETGEAVMKIEVDTMAVNQVLFDNKVKHLTANVSVRSPSVAKDSTSLNLENNAVNALTSKALLMPEIRQSRVDVIRQSISVGRYSVDPDKIAAAIIANNQERFSEVSV